MKEKKANWFKTWFDSEHYHKLYAHRDLSEAEQFINRLFRYLQLDKKHSSVLDLACGKGRHSLQVNELGYEVLGVDLSSESIAHAKAFENSSLKFERMDMRNFQYPKPFDLILNLFTSFGYFECDSEDIRVLNSISKNLKKEGCLVLDYLNSEVIVKTLPHKEAVVRENLEFDIHKYEMDGFVVKDIKFEDEGQLHHHREFVKLIDPAKFDHMLKQAGLVRVESFGDYHLNAFDPESSERFILIAKKIND